MPLWDARSLKGRKYPANVNPSKLSLGLQNCPDGRPTRSPSDCDFLWFTRSILAANVSLPLNQVQWKLRRGSLT